MIFKFFYIFFGHSPCRIGTHCLKHAGKASLLPFYMSGQHRTAADKDCRNIHPCRRHQKSRHIFITVWYHNKCIELVCHSHSLCRICDQISGYQRIFHADVSHSDSVAYRNRREHDGRSSCHGDSQLYCLHNLI